MEVLILNRFLELLKSLFYKFRVGLMRFMQGRNGVDELSMSALIAGIVFLFLSSLFGSFLMTLIGYILYGYALFRILSKNTAKRQEENRKYIAWSSHIRFETKAFFLRLKLRKEYKYFRCPGCRSRMRLQRGKGEVNMECPKCHKQFKQNS